MRQLSVLICVCLWACGDEAELPATQDGGAERSDAAAAVPDASSGAPDASSDAGATYTEPDVLSDEWKTSEASGLYGADAFGTYNVVLADEDLAFLDADPTAEKYVKGALEFGGKSYPAGVRYKASVGGWHRGGARCVGEGEFTAMPTGPKTCQKLSMKISFNEYDVNGRFMGLKKVLFHSLNQDPSLLRERLGYEVFRDLGVAAPRASHARVSINGKFQGVYAFVEYIDGRFTDSRFSSGDGNLYKEAWPAVDDNFVPNTPEYMTSALRTNDADGTVTPSTPGFLGFANEMAAASDDDARVAVMSKWLDMDYMIRYIAADRAVAHDDGVLHFYPDGTTMGAPWSNHNFYWYESVTHDHLWLIPWDMDNAWALNNVVTRINAPWNDIEEGCTTSIVEGYGISQIPPSCSPVIRAAANAKFSEAFNGYVAQLLDGPLSESVIDEKIERYSALLAASVEEASHFPGELSLADWETGKAQLRSALALNRNTLRAMIGRPLVQPDTVSMNGFVVLGGAMVAPLADVKVCVHDHPEVSCAMSDASGMYTLAGLPPESPVVVTFDGKDLVPSSRNFAFGGVDYSEAMADATSLWNVGTYLPAPAAGKGTIQLYPYGNSAGQTVTVTPDSGVAPVYYMTNAEGVLVPDATLTATSIAGTTVLQDVAPGEYQGMYAGCMAFASVGWGLLAKDGSSAVRFQVIPGYVMQSALQICP